MSQNESKWEHDLNNLERKTERGMWWVRIDRVRDIISEAISAREKEIAEEVKDMPEKYPLSVFTEPWEGWKKDISTLAKSKGKSIDCVSAWYGRWQGKLMKEDFLQILNHNK